MLRNAPEVIDRQKCEKARSKEVAGISRASIVKLNKGENVTKVVLLKICNGFDCELSDIMGIVEHCDKDDNCVTSS